MFEVLSDVDTKFAKVVDKECDAVSGEVRRWFKKLAVSLHLVCCVHTCLSVNRVLHGTIFCSSDGLLSVWRTCWATPPL